MKDYQLGDKVEVRNMPWKGVIGTYIRRIGPRLHEVELGDLLSGGSPRRVKVTKIRPVQTRQAEKQPGREAGMRIETIGELKTAVEDFDDALPVRLAFQPSHPIAAQVANVRTVENAAGEVVWIAATEAVPFEASPYAPRAAWEEGS